MECCRYDVKIFTNYLNGMSSTKISEQKVLELKRKLTEDVSTHPTAKTPRHSEPDLIAKVEVPLIDVGNLLCLKQCFFTDYLITFIDHNYSLETRLRDRPL